MRNWNRGKGYIPSKSASETSSLVTFNARRRIAIFWDFFESSMRFSCSKEGRTNFLGASLGTEGADLHPNNDSMAPSFNLGSVCSGPYFVPMQWLHFGSWSFLVLSIQFLC